MSIIAILLWTTGSLHPYDIPVPPIMRCPHECERVETRRLVAYICIEQKVLPRHAPQEDVQPAVAANKSAGYAEVADGNVGFGHGGDAAYGQRGGADDIDDGVEQKNLVIA